eukprot:scaffold3478_cov149-Pinguiococcus_pyrenoidosus.AAC.2
MASTTKIRISPVTPYWRARHPDTASAGQDTRSKSVHALRVARTSPARRPAGWTPSPTIERPSTSTTWRMSASQPF